MDLSRRLFTKILLGCITGLLALFYCQDLNLGAIELLRFVIGAAALWVPLGGWLYLLLRDEVPDRTVRLAFSAGVSYALTTLFFFAAATLHVSWLFYCAQIGAAAGLILYAFKSRRTLASRARSLRRFDWILAALVAASMVVNVPVQSVWRRDASTGGMIYAGWPDHLYHVGQAYELARHIPPRQATIRGGTPERAYHHFMSLTTMLVGRYAGQPDMLRAHLIYHYGVIQIFMCLLLYAIGKTLAASRAAGYCTLALMYLAVPPALNLWPVASLFYFVVFPHLTSGLDPVTLTSPQMYSGLVVLYAGLLGMLLLLERVFRGDQAPVVTFVTALTFAAVLRFRVHIAIAVLPAFVFVMLYLWRKKHQPAFLIAAFSTAAVACLLYLEMRLPVYLHGTINMRVGYNGLNEFIPFINTWPFCSPLHDYLRKLIAQPDMIKWAWEAISVSMFSFLNIVGIPLLIASAIYLASQRARSIFGPFNFLVIYGLATSICFAILLSSEYDKYSIGGQLPLHTRWYLFPFTGVALWMVWRFLEKRFSLPASIGTCLACLVVVGGFWYRLHGPISPLAKFNHLSSVRITADEWLAFIYLKTHTPPDSVVLTDRSWGFQLFVLSGLAGRAAFLEHPGNAEDQQALRLNPSDDRLALMTALRSSTSDEQFSRLLRSTPITHLLEFEDHPWPAHPPDCLTRLWESPEQKAVIWKVAPASHF
jgi:hypothetical protein